ncbi:MAG: flagellar biosynthesis anti-sigma factor FlgM [Proteobacteria bacterium]|nr:flagellar biosynthesis anti-sigma factor FlgM [Pseudomonadota bacterium]
MKRTDSNSTFGEKTGRQSGNTAAMIPRVVSSLCGERQARRERKVTSELTALTPQLSKADWQHIEEVISQLPDIDAARVVQLYNRIMADEYPIDAERIAEKLLALESALDR